MVKLENLSLTFIQEVPLTLPSPRRGEGGGEGKFQISLVSSNSWQPADPRGILEPSLNKQPHLSGLFKGVEEVLDPINQ